MQPHRVAVGLSIVNLLILPTMLAAGLRPTRTAAAAPSAQVSDASLADVAVLRGRALEIVDENGRIRSRIDVESNGEVVLRMTDRQGTIRVKLGAGEGGSGLMLADEATEPAVHIIARRTGTQARPMTTSLTLRAGNQQQVFRPQGAGTSR